MERPPKYTADNLTTIQSFILQEARRHPNASGEFSWLLSAIALAGKVIAAKIRRVHLDPVLDIGGDNVHGEQQKPMDLVANEIIIRCLGDRTDLGLLGSEEEAEPVQLRSAEEGGKYSVLFDPLDGSANLGLGVGVGTIFSILRHEQALDAEAPHLQIGRKQVAAGYVLYGPSTVLVLSTGRGVHMFSLDPAVGAFVLVRSDLKIPSGGKTYSLNEANADSFGPGWSDWLSDCRRTGWRSRYIGSMVADVHRTLLEGGVFAYPGTARHPDGKLRLMYEANPMAFLIEQAGGRGDTGEGPILDIKPTHVHQRVPVILGDPVGVDQLLNTLRR